MSIYNGFFGFKETPFSLTPDPEFLFLSSVHREALAFLRYGLRERKGFLLITGEVGSGKTTLLRALLKDVHREVRTALIINPRVTFEELISTVFADLEVDVNTDGMSKTELLDTFYEYVLEEHEAGRNIVLIFDEAQHLSMPVLEEIRMLSNFETPKQKLLQVLFVGQPELRQRLAMPQLRQLRQRITVRFHINPLSVQETHEYIRHRLHVATGEETDIFDADAIETIYSFSGGIPRLINVVCDAALLAAYADGETRISAAIAMEAVSEQEEYERGLDEFTHEPSPESKPAAVTSSKPSDVTGPDARLLLDLARKVLQLETELTKKSSELSEVVGQLNVHMREVDRRIETISTDTPSDLVNQIREATKTFVEQAGDDVDGAGHTAEATRLNVAAEKLELCLDLTDKIMNKISFIDDGDADSGDDDRDEATIDRRLRVNCSRCDGERFVEGKFCRHCWDHIRRIKMSGMLDS